MSNWINIRFVGFQLKRWMRAIDKEIVTANVEADRMPYRMATDYTDLLRTNITTGKFDSSYKPYNLRYFDWKYFVFGSNYGFWRLRGELFSAITVFKHRDKKLSGWMGGIPSGEMDSGNVSWLGRGDRGRRLPIALYARWMEFGRRGQPARPLFQPTLVEYKTGGAMQRLAETRRRFSSVWK